MRPDRMIAAAFGFGMGGMLVAWLGVKGGFYLDSASFLISGILIFFISSRLAVKIHSLWKNKWYNWYIQTCIGLLGMRLLRRKGSA